jgi:hypothetical protein
MAPRNYKTVKCKPARTWKGRFLYKYGRIDTSERLGWLKTIVLDHRVYVPTPVELNDPIEAKPRIAETELNSLADRVWGLWIRAHPEVGPFEQEQQKQVFRHDFKYFGIDWVIQTLHQSLHAELVHQRIYSLSKKPNNLHL